MLRNFRHIVLLFLFACACARADGVVATDAWLRAMPPGQPNAAIYLKLHNAGATQIEVSAASSPLAARVEFHESRQEDGMWRMRQLPAVALAPGETLEMAPGGAHLMVFGVARPLRPGDEVPLVLQLADGSEVAVSAEVRPLGGGGHDHSHH